MWESFRLWLIALLGGDAHGISMDELEKERQRADDLTLKLAGAESQLELAETKLEAAHQLLEDKDNMGMRLAMIHQLVS